MMRGLYESILDDMDKVMARADDGAKITLSVFGMVKLLIDKLDIYIKKDSRISNNNLTTSLACIEFNKEGNWSDPKKELRKVMMDFVKQAQKDFPELSVHMEVFTKKEKIGLRGKSGTKTMYEIFMGVPDESDATAQYYPLRKGYIGSIHVSSCVLVDGNKIDHSILQFEMSRKQSITNTDMMNQDEKYIERK